MDLVSRHSALYAYIPLFGLCEFAIEAGAAILSVLHLSPPFWIGDDADIVPGFGVNRNAARDPEIIRLALAAVHLAGDHPSNREIPYLDNGREEKITLSIKFSSHEKQS